jgi:hypothetical protein
MDVFDWKYAGNSLLTFVRSGRSNNSSDDDDDDDDDKDKNIRIVVVLVAPLLLPLVPSGNSHHPGLRIVLLSSLCYVPGTNCCFK